MDSDSIPPKLLDASINQCLVCTYAQTQNILFMSLRLDYKNGHIRKISSKMNPRDTAGDAKGEKSMNVLESCKCVNCKFKYDIHVGIASLASSGVQWCGEVCTSKVGDGLGRGGGGVPLSSPPPPSLLSPSHIKV